MALTIAIEGTGVIANCDSLTDTAGGAWAEEGGGTMALTPDVFLYGINSIAGQYANKDGYQKYTPTTPLNFGTGGNQEGEFIYMWLNMAAFAVLDDISTGGLTIRVSSSAAGTTDYKDFIIAGGNQNSNGVSANGWTGGWKLFVVDPNITASRSNGTLDLTSVLNIGIYMDTWDSVRAEAIFIDQIAVGTGLRITGTSTTGWKDVMEYCTDYANRAWGMVQERDGVYYIFGKIYIGDTNQAADTSFEDSGRILQFGTTQYYESSTWKTTLPTTACGIIIEDNATYKTTFKDGVIVGTDNGRSGSTIVGNLDQAVSLDLYGGNHADSITALYGTTLKGLTGAINSGNDANHQFFGTTFQASSQFDPVGAPVIRNCTFAETSDVDASLLWNESIDIQDSSFIANTVGAGIEHPSAVGTPYTHNNLIFSANTYDVLNSSGSAIVVEKVGSNTSTSEGSAVSMVTSVAIAINVKDQSGTNIVGALVYIDEDLGSAGEIVNTTTDANGDVNTSYSGAASTATIRVRKYGYKYNVGTVSLSSDSSTNVILITDPQQI